MATFRFGKYLAATILGSLLASAASATSVTVKAAISVGSYYDYVTNSYVSTAPITGITSYTFNIDQRSVIDYGSTTITQFGGVMGTTWSSPITSLVTNDPYGGAYGQFSASYVFPNVSDYPTNFIEDAAAQANAFYTDGTNYADYHIELRATRRLAPRNGDGSSDYAFDSNALLDYYRSFIASGESVYFNESYGTYGFVDGLPVYSDGKSWVDYGARLIDVTVDGVSVPEPATAFLLAPCLLYCFRRSRIVVEKTKLAA
ncbi:MAG: hypothetical protein RLZZ200_1923 [Pseudomonadota bacterium]